MQARGRLGRECRIYRKNRPRFLRHHHPVAIQLDKPGIRDAEKPERPAGQEDPELAGDPGLDAIARSVVSASAASLSIHAWEQWTRVTRLIRTWATKPWQ